MKKTIVTIALVLLYAGIWAQSEPKGIQPQMVQAAFYTPTYQCFYLKGSDELKLAYTPNSWCTYETAITKDTITYDGIAGKYKNLNVIRIKSNTKKAKQQVVLYIDNITVKNGKGETVLFLDFEDGDAAGPYFSQGKPLDTNGTVVEKDGRKCFLLNMNSQSLYGYSGVEVQWTLPENEGKDGPTWDMSAGDYSVKYDYYIAVAN